MKDRVFVYFQRNLNVFQHQLDLNGTSMEFQCIPSNIFSEEFKCIPALNEFKFIPASNEFQCIPSNGFEAKAQKQKD